LNNSSSSSFIPSNHKSWGENFNRNHNQNRSSNNFMMNKERKKESMSRSFYSSLAPSGMRRFVRTAYSDGARWWKCVWLD
jgi:hypothetical protein